MFDKLKNKDIPLSPKSALALAALTVISCDGDIDQEEIISLKRMLRGDEPSFDKALEWIKHNNFSIPESVTAVTNILNDRQKLTTIVNLLDIAMADGVLARDEEELIMEYTKAFELDENTIENIVEVIALKNDLSIFD